MKLKVKVLHVRVQVIMLKVLLPIQAQKLNLTCIIFMPVTTPLQKVNQVRVLWK